MASPHDRAWSEGHKAGKHDQPVSSSPYKKGMMHTAWLRGWAAAQKARDA